MFAAGSWGTAENHELRTDLDRWLGEYGEAPARQGRSSHGTTQTWLDGARDAGARQA